MFSGQENGELELTGHCKIAANYFSATRVEDLLLCLPSGDIWVLYIYADSC